MLETPLGLLGTVARGSQKPQISRLQRISSKLQEVKRRKFNLCILCIERQGKRYNEVLEILYSTSTHQVSV
jgi:hypothetical protein